MREQWNTRYSSEEYIYGTSPNEFFAEQLKLLIPGRILLPADGEGRNAVHAAMNGWKVDAFDQSDVGREKALNLAAKNMVSINYQIAEVPGFNPGIEAYDCIGLIYFHLPPQIRSDFSRMIIQALKPGGTIILEAFSKEQLSRNSGGPKSEELLYSIELVSNDFSGLEFRILEQCKTHLNEGSFHAGEAEVIRMLGVKAG